MLRKEIIAILKENGLGNSINEIYFDKKKKCGWNQIFKKHITLFYNKNN